MPARQRRPGPAHPAGLDACTTAQPSAAALLFFLSFSPRACAATQRPKTTPYLFPFPACSAPAQPVSQPCGLPLFPLKTFDSLPPPRLFRRPHNSSRHNPANPFGTLFCQSGCCSWLPLQSDARCLATCNGTMCLSAAACWAFESGPRAQPVCRSACPAFMPACLLAALCRCSHTQCNTCCIQQHSESRRAALGATRCCWLLRLTTPGFFSCFSSDPALLHSGCPFSSKMVWREEERMGGEEGKQTWCVLTPISSCPSLP